MKFTKLLITAACASLLLLPSCSEERLNEGPVDQFPIQDAIKSENDMRSILNGAYDQYSTSTAFGADILAFGDLISDNVFITALPSDVAYRNTGFLNWSADISDFGMLDDLYDGIILANTVVNNTSLPDTPNVLNLKGEARIARAVGYFYAVAFYSPNPTSNVNQEFGVPLNLGNYDPNQQLPRATVDAVYDQIITDLTTALNIMSDEAPVNKGFLSPTAARLLLSRVYLTRGKSGDYQKAIDYADQVINAASPGSLFNFVSKDDYVKYFTSSDVTLSENQPETVWEINMNATSGENSGINNSLSSFYEFNGSKKRFLFRQNFYSTFASTDVRRSLFNSAAVPTQDNPLGIWTRKYYRNTSEGPFAQNVKIFRMSEVKLNKIEALFKSGNTALALTELNNFALSRGAQGYAEVNLENILNERRKEFFAEGHRFFDLKRNNLGFTKVTNCYSIVCEVAPNDKLFVIPMSLRERNINLNMTQYPGW
ncbi:MAG: RagB/SusD family nutrient uptake outer membrane protein [Flavobacteriia bacterium]|nr:RagB/SusD family nutrient uptake outer membrane protein [Flavobacteriia bacterium]MBH2023657.1 RagB/SusD family nutrient uptake outer membrane protein [Flavobacteriales bacterium]